MDRQEQYHRIIKTAQGHGYRVCKKRDLPGVYRNATYAEATAVTMDTLPGGYASIFLLTEDGPVIDVWKAAPDIAKRHALSLRRRRLITAEEYQDLKRFYAEAFTIV